MNSIDQEIIFAPNSKILVKNSEHRPRGVFANSKIEKNELIERCPLIPLSFRSRYNYDPQIWQYCYTSKKCECKECQTHGFIFYMVLGYGMVYNHSLTNNADIIFNYENLYMDVIANRNIEINEEIYVNFSIKNFID